jgi:hypothetical protein
MDTVRRQATMARIIRDMVREARGANERSSKQLQIVQLASGYAFALYMDRRESRRPAEFSDRLQKRLGPAPEDPTYFQDLDALDEFVHQLGSLLSFSG